MTEKSQVNDYNDNAAQREAIVYAANTIQFLSSLIAKIGNAFNIIWIQNDIEDAQHHFDKLKALIPPRTEKRPDND